MCAILLKHVQPSKLVPTCKGRFMHIILRFRLGTVFSTTSAPPNRASTDMCQNRLLLEKTGPSLSLVLRIIIHSEPVVVAIQFVRVRLSLVSLFERFDPFPGHQYRHPRPVELREMVGPVVVGASHHVRPEPPPCELLHRLVLVVEAIVIYQNPVAFLDFPRP